MNNIGLRRVFNTLSVLALLYFGFFMVYSYFSPPAARLIAPLRWSYIWTKALILWVEALIPISASAAMIAYSLFIRVESGALREEPFHALVSSHLVLFTVLALLFTGLYMGVLPSARGGLERREFESERAEFFLERAQAAHQAHDYAAAVADFDRYLARDPHNEAVGGQREEAHSQLLGSGNDGGSEAGVPEPVQPLAASEYLARAQDFYSQEDYFSAHYYAVLANRLDSSRQDARRLAARAWEKIASLQPSRDDEEVRALFRTKKEGYAALVREQDSLKAYYIFNNLAKSYPQDPDVARYLEESRKQVEAISYFLDEAEAVEGVPGSGRILFVNVRQDNRREIVYIDNLVETEQGTFVTGVEVIQFEAGGGSDLHLASVYGKILPRQDEQEGSTIVLTGLDRNDPGRRQTPSYFTGDPRRLAASGRFENLLPLNLSREDLAVMRLGFPAAESLGLSALWQLRRRCERYGYPGAELAGEILDRILHPFSFLILCLFSVSLGWTFRVGASRPPRLGYVFLPFFPLGVALLTALYLGAQKTILDFVLGTLGFASALAVLLIMQGVLLFVALTVLAGQRTD
jgi:tetratricopeptide (TPR) repeat protein